MVRDSKWKDKKNATWITRNPSTEEVYEQFKRAIQSAVEKYRNGFTLSPEDCDDLFNDIFVRLMEKTAKKPGNRRKVFFMLRVISSQAAEAMKELRGGKPKNSKLSNDQRTVSLSGHEETVEYSDDPITQAITAIPDWDSDIALQRVRTSLHGNALLMFEFVLHKREKHSVGGIAAYCHGELKMDSSEISEARMQIVEAMHQHGLALNYPPPASLTKERKRMTDVERLKWLDDLRSKYKDVEDAAKNENCTRNAINHHCKRLHGISFPEWITR